MEKVEAGTVFTHVNGTDVQAMLLKDITALIEAKDSVTFRYTAIQCKGEQDGTECSLSNGDYGKCKSEKCLPTDCSDKPPNMPCVTDNNYEGVCHNSTIDDDNSICRVKNCIDNIPENTLCIASDNPGTCSGVSSDYPKNKCEESFRF